MPLLSLDLNSSFNAKHADIKLSLWLKQALLLFSNMKMGITAEVI